ncbi:hypothetical protein H4J55_00405 [Colwellia sp. MB3u-22]|jgi:hypothetical protein|nr:hypothetical protein [Colwellia sp. MB3u-22]
MEVDVEKSKGKTIVYKIMKFFVLLSCIPFFGIVFSPLPVIYSIFNKHIKMIKVSTICLTLNLLLVWFIYEAITATDPFTDDLYIPNDIEISKPISLEYDRNNHEYIWEPHINNSINQTNFDLVNSHQPGIYEFALWYKSNVNGYLYIKAYEITKGTRLSVSRLKERSLLEVESSSKLTFYHNDFSIYEGDWGYPYAAKIEVWFCEDPSTEGFKVMEKNYIIEGWMR